MKNKKEKLSLNALKVKSFTTISQNDIKKVKGGKASNQNTSVAQCQYTYQIWCA